jgi:hypothetical protein
MEFSFSGWVVSSRISELPVMSDSCNSIMHVILDKREALFLLWWIFDKMTGGPQNVKRWESFRPRGPLLLL